MKKIEPNILGWDEHVGVYKLNLNKDSNVPVIPHEQFILERGIENVLRFSLVSRHLRWLQGELLTILEATIDDDRKLKATKDLMKDKISSKISWLYEQCGCPEDEQGLLEDNPNMVIN